MRILIVLTFLSGCSMPKSEIYFHAVNAIDTYQTIEIGSNPCYIETGTAQPILGDQPKPAETIALMATVSILYHLSLKKWPDSPTAKLIRGMFIAGKTKVVHDNYQLFREPC